MNIMEPHPTLPHLHRKEEVNRALTAAPNDSLITSCSLSPTSSAANAITDDDDDPDDDDDAQGGAEKSLLLHLANNDNLSAWGGNNHEPTLRTYSRIVDVTDDENVGGKKKKKEEEIIIENDNEPIPHIIATITIDDACWDTTSPSTSYAYHSLTKHQPTSLPRLEVIDDCDSGPGPLPQMVHVSSCNQVAAMIEERATTKKSPPMNS